MVLGADAVQRHRFSDMAALAGTSLALLALVAARSNARTPARTPARSAARGDPAGALPGSAEPLPAGYAAVAGDLLLALAAHGWVAAWWYAQWLPGTAWWALASALPSVAALLMLPGPAAPAWRRRWSCRLSWLAAIGHGLLQTAALLAVASLR